VGYARKPPVFMQPGDTIEIDIEGIGILKNGIMQAPAQAGASAVAAQLQAA
jgi:2-keto-4-pentenoate hydratase/2-oxohepta-3-ene-1,7-dioic acid hydratase in catechol pathway